ncbi:hypothetical protein R6Q59_019056 [Mikania micrantha]|uniref:Uncharacterized protein n=1 Tax=Mikania micrantha TaxID=192012 RepID=A0A5N6LJQ5_9ASTR|nr:hypothetical protein E3N88_41750 [Mikania micrantha]
MASLIQENQQAINDQDDQFDKFESLEIDDTLLMSILEEPQVENECDDERLSSVIRSLEAEISPIVIDDHDMSLELEWNVDWEGYPINQNLNLESNWMDMDDDIYIHECEDGIIEYGGVKDYSQTSYGKNIEEYGYGALWQEIN